MKRKPVKAKYSLQTQAKGKTKTHLPVRGDERVWHSRHPAVPGSARPSVHAHTPGFSKDLVSQMCSFKAKAARFSNKHASVGQSWAIVKEEIEAVKVTGK